METIHLSYPLKTEETFPPISLAIGYFDGVHRGHQAVIQRARKIAADLGVISGVMTFYPHPRDVLGKAKVNQYLTPLPDKLAQFERLGVERVYVMRFDRELAARSKESFVEDVLLPLQVKGVTVGFNFTFGRGAKGKAEDLATLGAGRLQVEVVRPIQHQALSVSSTRLRQALDQGRVEEACEILGRPYTLRGSVVQGDQRGRTIGYPTANLNLDQPFIVPKQGVYVVRVRKGEKVYHGMMNIGVRPTFKEKEAQRTLEVHLFDVNEDLYGNHLQVEFLHHLRDEVPFDSVDDLIAQLQQDEQNARSWLDLGKGANRT
ncbi:riboflavin kinase / FMN adenylyltransferase [Melghirimyces thermohalophilus]|uniref:Riboflavin biosynthesis protein n=1 Tax=Melghirimyces thermohalophilus TaxID=1236220 RepID=A0A1G6J2B7_9BACL|nr:bifunctional riboflavin kinase/FAD synthetase [Melghirimyces thermohalophilus]SDC12485.1 riboflavin kinase / FMN adenylyltransferase [Melghirimyces thermohalophilus]